MCKPLESCCLIQKIVISQLAYMLVKSIFFHDHSKHYCLLTYNIENKWHSSIQAITMGFLVSFPEHYFSQRYIPSLKNMSEAHWEQAISAGALVNCQGEVVVAAFMIFQQSNFPRLTQGTNRVDFLLMTTDTFHHLYVSVSML